MPVVSDRMAGSPVVMVSLGNSALPLSPPLPDMFTQRSASLAGVRVVSLATNLPGPLAARHLQRLGASVIKIEPPAGDAVQAFPKWYQALNKGQTIEALDLKTQPGTARFVELLTDADMLISSMRPSAAERLGLYNLVQQAGVAHIEIIGDLEAPNAPGHDLTYQAAAGVLASPQVPRVPWADVIGGYQATIAALDALREREQAQANGNNVVVHRRIGLKQGVDEAAEAYRFGATAPGEVLSGAHPQYAIYKTQDGWIAVAALEPHFHARLTTLLGESFVTLTEHFAKYSTAEWLEFANQHDLPFSAVEDN